MDAQRQDNSTRQRPNSGDIGLSGNFGSIPPTPTCRWTPSLHWKSIDGAAMFASKVARAQPKTAELPTNQLMPQRSMLMTIPIGGGMVEQVRSPHQALYAAARGREAAKAATGRPQLTPGARCVHNFGAINVARKDGVVHGPAGAANRFDDCPAQWKPAANAAQTRGSSWLDNVVNGLTSLPKPIPVPVANLLTKHFHTTFDKDITKIAGRFKQLSTAIKQSIDFQCETSCDPNVLAYVYSIWSDLHLCPY